MNYFSIDYIYRDIMPEVQYRKNVTSCAYFNHMVGDWKTVLTAMPDFSPDECIVRLITFRSEHLLPNEKDLNIYLIWSNITNDIIGSMHGSSSTVSPNITLLLSSPLANELRFRLLTPVLDGAAVVDELVGEIVIHLEFVKYKRTPQRV